MFDFLLPFLLIGFGIYFRFFTPQNKASALAYRTKASLKSDHHFEAAHRYLGLLWISFGAFAIFLYLLLLFIPLNFFVRSSLFILIVILLVFLSIRQTEKYLAKL
ncbi:SdpI family protein [Listeria aquatica]|uniref:SdpI family protein n=1 Tax=Listeria aquatica TaxID=1494960 RepID=A0A841ZP13_9LIST|nr:SdpI family protein [Listeria aquatica]MBC1521212.1 SdpI family protein [Listeria aquatica]